MTALNKQALLIENGQLVADTLRHLADNEIDSDYFAITSTNENGTEIDHELVITDYALQAAGTVDELVRALEAAEKKSAARLEAIDRTHKMFQRERDRADTAEKRAAELEARGITVEQFRSFVTDDDLAALHRFAECCDDPESGGHDLEKEQVRRLAAIGAFQRSGRICYITDFGDVLISITAGIGVKGE
ncbi:TPA: hypothetical protein ACGR9Y_000917 [Citrobacter freundii]